jgi:hypothetical protein
LYYLQKKKDMEGKVVHKIFVFRQKKSEKK